MLVLLLMAMFKVTPHKAASATRVAGDGTPSVPFRRMTAVSPRGSLTRITTGQVTIRTKSASKAWRSGATFCLLHASGYRSHLTIRTDVEPGNDLVRLKRLTVIPQSAAIPLVRLP